MKNNNMIRQQIPSTPHRMDMIMANDAETGNDI
jgi:hypothetical protein